MWGMNHDPWIDYTGDGDTQRCARSRPTAREELIPKLKPQPHPTQQSLKFKRKEVRKNSALTKQDERGKGILIVNGRKKNRGILPTVYGENTL